MQIKYITCSDPRENISVDDAIKILTYAPNIEFGVQADGSSMSQNKPRNTWLRKILETSNSMSKPLNIALHVNYDWCDSSCNLNIPLDLLELCNMLHNRTGMPLVQRLQFNIGDETQSLFNINNMQRMIKYFKDQKIIFPYNGRTKNVLDKLHDTGAKFSILNDASYGMGRTPDTWPAPAYGTKHKTGYSGGLCAQNVQQCLTDISKFNTELCNETWVDAEGKLMKHNTQTREMDLDRVMEYINKVLEWQKQYQN